MTTPVLRWRHLILALGLAAAAVHAGVEGPTNCKATPISADEAEKLVRATPELVDASNEGRTPNFQLYSLPSDSFYHFEVRSTPPAGQEPDADGGLLGYFAVQKATGRVVDTVLGEDVAGPGLDVLQRTLRRKHCIGADLVKKLADKWPQ
jgi:hypothetical protein